MRAAALRDGEIVVRDDVPEPVPGFGQVLVAGARRAASAAPTCTSPSTAPTMLALGDEMEGVPDLGAAAESTSPRDVFMGHEFAAEVLEVGPDTDGPPRRARSSRRSRSC